MFMCATSHCSTSYSDRNFIIICLVVSETIIRIILLEMESKVRTMLVSIFLFPMSSPMWNVELQKCSDETDICNYLAK